jgi:hypothetical protein
VGKYLKAIGGSEKLAAVRTLRMSGKYHGDRGYVTAVLQVNRRPNMERDGELFMLTKDTWRCLPP